MSTEEPSQSIVIENRNGSLVVLFNRPERRSPLSEKVLDELLEILYSESILGGCDRIVFTGRDGVFAAGADLVEIERLNSETAPSFARKGQQLMNLISCLPQHTIAAIDGFCFGGALDLAISCDTRISSPTSKFCHPGVGLGIITGWGGTQRLPRLLGESRALDMLLTARIVEAEGALRIGLIDEISIDPLERALSL
jgi:enoyl-CoA hydratase